MTRSPSVLRKLNLLFWSMLFSALLLEFAARIFVNNVAPEDQFLRFASLRQLQQQADKADGREQIISPHRYIGYIPTPGYVKGKNKHNLRGFRGEDFPPKKPEGEFRIVCVGGSTTYSTEIEDFKLAYPFLLQKVLAGKGYDNVRVINGGAPGYSTWETLVSFEYRVLDLDPDLVIVYHAINDIKPRLVWPPHAYWGDNSGARSAGQPLFMPSILEYSTALRMAMVSLGWTKPHADFENVVLFGSKSYFGSQFRNQVARGIYPQGIFETVPVEKMLDTNGPVYFQRNLESLVHVARGRNIGVVFSTFQYCPDNDPLFALPAYEREFVRINRLIKRMGAEMDVPVFDYAASFPSDKEFYVDGCHVNPKGSHLKARQFGSYLDEQGLVPKGG